MDFGEIANGDRWELFTRDFFAALGFVVEVPPGRGLDGGRDLLVSEQLRGALASRRFTWLVSCKHQAHSGKAVGLDDEPSIADRLRRHRAHGFLGFYPTMASSALIERLRALTEPRPGEAPLIQRFEIFDAARITARFHAVGLAEVALQHLPQAYAALRPVHALGAEYGPLRCEVCGEDVLLGSVARPFSANILFAKRSGAGALGEVVSVHTVCKGGACVPTYVKTTAFARPAVASPAAPAVHPLRRPSLDWHAAASARWLRQRRAAGYTGSDTR